MGDPDWVFDYMCDVLQSPTWEVPVMSFIDDTCAIFDTEEENKLTHMDAHQEFKALVERLLVQHLTEVGISPDDFYEACEQSYQKSDNSDFATQVIEQLIACDDFMTFKSIMIRRNKELEMEALMTLDATDDDIDALEGKEQEELAQALDLSEETARLLEMSALEKEQADVEKAIAMSLLVEEERLEMLQNSGIEGKSSDESKESKHDESKSSGPRNPMCAATALPPLGKRNAPISQQRDYFEENRKVVDDYFKKPQPAAVVEGEFDEVDVARRKKHLENQRKKLIAKKNKERAARLKEFEEQKRDTSQATETSVKKAPQRKISSDQGHLTYALARRMKQDLVHQNDSMNGGYEHSSSAGGEVYSSLDAKLRKVEELRQQRASLMKGI